jgi:DUF4097 and DUF4098 domain-containing protein YvlB
MSVRVTAGTRVNIDGRDLVGRSIVINGDKVTVDGVEQPGSLVGPVSVTVYGNVESLDGAMASVGVSGSCGAVKTMSGDVRCGDVSGDVSTMSGDVTCGRIGGAVKTRSGDIHHGR